MRIIKLYALTFFLLTNIVALGQFQEKPVNIQSPNASSLSQFKEIPVSYFTGTPGINIPVYTLKTSKAPVSISLSYHASGFKPDVHPGWVGLGWNVDAGGMISRKVNDMPDEYDITWSQKLGFFYQYKILDTADWAAAAYAKSIDADIANFSKDTEPDEFSFNFLNYSGKFYLDEKGKWQVKCDQAVQVVFNNVFIDPPFPPAQNYNAFIDLNSKKFLKSFNGFTIITEDGTQYIFGGSPNEIEYSIGMFAQQAATWLANTWHLKQIIYPSGQKIDFTYERIAEDHNGKFICSMYESVFYKSYQKKKNGNAGLLDVTCLYNPIGLPYYGIYGGDLISPVYLTSIETDLEKIVFEKSPSTELKYSPAIFFNVLEFQKTGKDILYFLPYLEIGYWEVNNYFPSDTPAMKKVLDRMVWQKLDKIKVINKTDNKPYKEFSLNYNNKPDERLMLLSMQEADSTLLVQHPPYKFVYDFNFMQAANKLPPYLLSRQSDHWGYYNSTVATPSLIDNYHTKKNPKGINPLVGVLNKIIYPTGGLTYLQYEDHSYRKAVPEIRNQNLLLYNKDEIAGGIRIKNIVDSGNFIPNNFLQRNYIYKQGFTPSADLQQLSSSGVLGGQSRYFWDEYITQASNNPGVNFYQKVFSSNSVLPASNNSMGSHIGYTEVIERLANKGYIKYIFSNFDTDNGVNRDELATLNLQPTRTPYEPYNSKEHKRGNVQSKEYYDSSGILIKKEVFEYTTLLAGKFIRALRAYNENMCDGSSDIINIGTAYKHYLETEKIKKHIVYDYAKNNSTLVFVKEFTYDDYKNIIAEKFVDSKLDTFLIEYKYPYHFPSPPVDLTPCLNSYLSCKSDCKAYSGDKDALMGCYMDCDAGKIQCEQQLINNANKNNPYARMVAKNMISTVIEKRIYSVKNGLKYLTKAELNTYKEFYADKIFKETSYIYESPTLKEAGAIINTNYTTKLNFDPGYKANIKYNYDNAGNILEQSKTENASISYIWDYANTYPIAEVQDAATSAIAYSSFEASGTGNWNNLQPNKIIADSKAITGIRCYNIVGTTLNKYVENNKTYTVSLWAKDNSVRVNNIAATKTGATINGWTYYEWTVTGAAQAIVSGNCNIDELRLYPVNARMTTYAYDPIIGITHQCDANNIVGYYEYDPFNRLKFIKDYKGNTLQSFNYNYSK